VTAIGGFGAALAPAVAQAKYPDRAVSIIIAWPAGGATDLVGRVFQEAFSKAVGGQTIIKNVVGAAGTIGATEAAMASADGHTLLLTPIGRAPRGREPSVREDLTQTIVDWSGSWRAMRPGNWPDRSLATRAALGRPRSGGP